MSNPRLRKFLLGLAGSGLVACSASPSEPTVTVAPDGARIITAEGALTASSTRAPLAVVRDYLRLRGAGLAVEGLKVASSTRHEGITQLRLEQELEGVRVYKSYVKAALNGSGELLHLIERVAPVDAPVAPARIGERDALARVLAHLGYEVPAPREQARRGMITRYERLAVFHAEPSVERVLFLDDAQRLQSGFVVTTWGQDNNQLDETLVDGKGQIVSVERRTANERYNVFLEDPDKGSQTIVGGAVNNASPNGWLNAGSHRDIHIVGNNTATYLDADANNSPDTGGSTISNGDFLAVADLTVSPATANNRAVAVQNLFYLNNVMHDVLHRHGFNEANGNFQKDNFGRGGLGNDPVLAEAQDGSGTDNANFATPNDGSSPRMQMFLWSGVDADGLLTVDGRDYEAYGSTFGAALTLGGTNGPLSVYNDNSGVASDGCEASAVPLTGRIVIVDRGTCNFTVKVLNAQKAGAVGVIIANNATGGAFAPGGTDRKVKIPSAMVSLEDGQILRGKVTLPATLRKNPVPPLLIDADIDADIVFHEYGHGLTWRMIGSMSGALAGAIGEGASDVVAFLMNGDDRIGEYAYSNPLGIRRAPYADYTTTYSGVTGAEVHDDGEIYAAAMWRVFELYQAANLSADDLMSDFVDGMNYTPAGPAFENMRDGMLASVQARGRTARQCLIWRGFAEFGIGVGARGTVSRRGVVSITESFALPTQCQ